MAETGVVVSALGVATSGIAVLLLFAHVTNRYHAHVTDMGSIAVGYLGLIGFGTSLSVLGVALLVSARKE